MYKTVIHQESLNATQRARIGAVIDGSYAAGNGCTVISHEQRVAADRVEHLAAELGMDISCLPAGFQGSEVRLLITDMDSTFINIECIDEIADFAGVKPQVKAITDAAMRGELDFEGSLTRRVALLKGLSGSVLDRVYRERLQLNPGAERMLACLKRRDIKIALVSGGFTFFTERLKARCDLDFTISNVLETDGDVLTGRVQGSIVGAQTKADFLGQLMREHGWEARQVIAMGDGANDLPMLRSAGLSIAYHAKPKVRAQAHVALNHGGLEAVCHLLDVV